MLKEWVARWLGLDRLAEENAQLWVRLERASAQLQAERERAERAEVAKADRQRRKPFWARATTAAWLLVIGLVLGGTAVPHIEDRPYLVPEIAEDDLPLAPQTVRPQTLAWQDTGARSYRVEVRSGTSPVVTERVTEPRVTVSLPPGEYRWLVWPGRSNQAIVNSVLGIR